MSLKKVCQEGNKWVTFATVGAAVTGLYSSHPGLTRDSIPEYLFFTAIIAFRVKLYLDDEVFFLSKAEFLTRHFKIGMIFAVASWILIILSALSIATLDNAYLFFLFAVAASTLWIVAEAFRIGAYREQNIWVGKNAIYMAILAFLIWLHPDQQPIYDWAALAALLIAIAVDWGLSDPVSKLHQLEAKT